MKRMIVLSTRESFRAHILISKAKAAGVDCTFVPFIISELEEGWKDAQLVTVFMEDDTWPKETVLSFMADNLEKKGGKLIVIGEKEDIEYVSSHVSADHIYKIMVKPIDNAEFVKTVSEYFEENYIEAAEDKKHLLVVDDDPQYLSLVRQWLKEDYKVSMVNSGLQAIKFLEKNKVDLVLLDYEMPVTSGAQVLGMLRNDGRTERIPVFFLTGKSDKDSVMDVMSLKPEGYILKSIQRDELLERLKDFLVIHAGK
ncbi:MAG: response regulator [Oribacterium sp.]|nr:response regulator [Oribacterium sp.]